MEALPESSAPRNSAAPECPAEDGFRNPSPRACLSRYCHETALLGSAPRCRGRPWPARSQRTSLQEPWWPRAGLGAWLALLFPATCPALAPLSRNSLQRRAGASSSSALPWSPQSSGLRLLKSHTPVRKMLEHVLRIRALPV